MGINYDGYEGSAVDNIPTTTFVCGVCGIEMIETQRTDSTCQSCGKEGWLITYKCNDCGAKIDSYNQNMTRSPFCYCNN